MPKKKLVAVPGKKVTLMDQINETEVKAIASIKGMVARCENITGRSLKNSILTDSEICNERELFEILDRLAGIEQPSISLTNAMRFIGKWVKEHKTFPSGKAFLDWAERYIIEGGKCS